MKHIPELFFLQNTPKQVNIRLDLAFNTMKEELINTSKNAKPKKTASPDEAP